MSPPRQANPSAAALRKRERRAAEKREDLEAFLEKQNKAQRAYREKKEADQDAAIAAAAGPEEGAPSKAREELAKCRQQVCTETANVLGDFFRDRIKDAESARAAAPELKAAAVQAAKGTQAVMKLEKALNKADLTQRLYEFSQANEGTAAITEGTAKGYIDRLFHLQRLLTGRSSPTLDLAIFQDADRVLKVIDEARAASGAKMGEPLALASMLVYIGAAASVTRRVKGMEEAHKRYSEALTRDHETYEKGIKQNLMSAAEQETYTP